MRIEFATVEFAVNHPDHRLCRIVFHIIGRDADCAFGRAIRSKARMLCLVLLMLAHVRTLLFLLVHRQIVVVHLFIPWIIRHIELVRLDVGTV